MKGEKNKVVSACKIIYIIVFAIVLTILFSLSYLKNCQYFKSNQIIFNEDVKVKINDNEEQTVNFENFTFEPLSNNDTLTIKIILPDVSIEDPVISFLV